MPDFGMTTLFYFTYALLAAIVIANSVVLLGVVHVVYELRQTTDETSQEANILPAKASLASHLAPGSDAPDLVGTDVSGARVDSREFRGMLWAALFVSPSCSSCAVTLDEISALSWKVGGRVVVVCRGNAEECAAVATKHRVAVPTISDEDNEIAKMFGVAIVPLAVLISPAGTIQSYGFPSGGERELGRMFEGAAVARDELEVVKGG